MEQIEQELSSAAYEGDINRFAELEHIYWQKVGKKDENEDVWHDCFKFIESLSRLCLKKADAYTQTAKAKKHKDTNYKYCILLRAPLLLHTDFLEEFLYGLRFTSKKEDWPVLVCIDQPLPERKPYEGLRSIDLYKLDSPLKKIIKYKELAKYFELAIWFACPQNMSLYMGNRFCRRDAIWTQKHLKSKPGASSLFITGGHRKGHIVDSGTIWIHGRSLPYSSRQELGITIRRRENKQKRCRQ